MAKTTEIYESKRNTKAGAPKLDVGGCCAAYCLLLIAVPITAVVIACCRFI